VTTDFRAQPNELPRRGFAQRLARERALVTLFDLGGRKGFALRAAQLYAFGVLVAYAALMLLMNGEQRRAELSSVLYAALASLSWVVGALAAFGTARNLTRSPDRAGLVALARSRGFSARDMLRARVLAASLRVARLIAIPALLLLALTLVRGQTASFVLLRAPGIVLYAALLGMCLAILAEISAELAPRHTRALLAALVLGPVLFAQVYAWVPSLPATFASLLDRLFTSGGGLT